MGPRADPPVAGDVPARGDLRDARGDRVRRRRPPARGARRPAAPGVLPRADRRGARSGRVRRRRRGRAASPTSSSTGTRTSSPGSRSPTPTRSTATGRRSRPRRSNASSPVDGHPGRRCPALAYAEEGAWPGSPRPACCRGPRRGWPTRPAAGASGPALGERLLRAGGRQPAHAGAGRRAGAARRRPPAHRRSAGRLTGGGPGCMIGAHRPLTLSPNARPRMAHHLPARPAARRPAARR